MENVFRDGLVSPCLGAGTCQGGTIGTGGEENKSGWWEPKPQKPYSSSQPNLKNLIFFPWKPQTLNLNPKTETLNLNFFPWEAQTLKTLKFHPGAKG